MDANEYQPLWIPPIVVDTMVLVDDVIQGLRRSDSTALRRVLAIAEGRASISVVDETRVHLPWRALKAGVDPRVAVDVFESSYMPLLTIGDPPNEPSADPRVRLVEARDPDDVPTAHLVVSTAPAVCLTRDRDLLDSGLGTAEWLDLVLAIEDLAEFKAILEGTVLLSQLVGMGVSRLTRTNPWLIVALAAVLAVVAMRLPDPAHTLVQTRKHLANLGHLYLEHASRGVLARDHVKSQLVLPLDQITNQSGHFEI